MTLRDQFLAIDPAGELGVRPLCGGSRIAIAWRARGRSGTVESDSYEAAMADVLEAARAPAAPPAGQVFVGRSAFINRGDFLGGKSDA